MSLASNRLLGLVLALLVIVVATSAQAQPIQRAGLQPRVINFFPTQETPLPDGVPFALQLAEPMADLSKAQALCDVWGVRSSVPTQIVMGAKREEVLKIYGVRELDPRAPKPWVVLRCLSGFPDGAKITLRWLKPKPSDSGEQDFWDGQHMNFRAESGWPFVVQCTRSNPAAQCNPLSPVVLQFNRPIKTEGLAAARLKDASGKTYAPSKKANDWRGYSSHTQLIFDNLAANARLTLEFPKGLQRDDGTDALAAVRGKQRTVSTSDYPPLVKFASSFGVVERQVGVAPITLRNVESRVSGTASVKLRSLHITDPVQMIEAIATNERIARADNSPNLRDYGHSDSRWFGGEPEPEDEPNTGAARNTRTVAKAAKPRFPFAPFELASTRDQTRRPAVVTETRAVSWLARLPGVRTTEVPRTLEAKAFEVVGIPLRQPGLHLLEAESPRLGRELLAPPAPMYVRSAALVTDLAVHLHSSDRTAAIWVTSLASGQPVAGARVSVYDCKAARLGGKAALNTTTDAKGFASIELTSYQDTWSCPIYAFATLADDIGLVRSDWNHGVETWRFTNDEEGEGDSLFYGRGSRSPTHVLMPRNLLRAGEGFFAKLYVRSIDAQGQIAAARPSDMPANAAIVHQGSGEKVEVPITWDSRGNGNLAWRIPEGAKRGYYTLMVRDSAARFRVDDFRLPSLKAEVSSPPVAQVAGSTIPIQLRLSYLSGGPAAGERVKVTQRLVAHNPFFPGHEGYWFGVGLRWSEQSAEAEDALKTLLGTGAPIEEGEVALDAAGTAVVRAQIGKTLNAPKQLLTDMEYRDPNGETYRAQNRIAVWPAQVMLGAKHSPWADLASGKKERRIEFKVVNPAGQPMANVPVQVTGAYHGYMTYRVKTVGGFFSYQNREHKDTPKRICSGKSDARGMLLCEFVPSATTDDGETVVGGAYRVVGTAQDSVGRTSTVVLSFWQYPGEQSWFEQSDHDRITVLAQKSRFAPGETAALQIRSPFREGTALISIMRAGTVVDTLVMPVSGSAPVLQIPIKPSYAPNVFVNVLVVRGRVAEPAPTALVDLARPAFKLGLVALDVQHPHHALAVKLRTDKAVYQSRETAKIDIEVTPHASAPFKGDQEVALFAIDEALLELYPNGTWDALKTMMARRDYGFETASAAMQVIGKRHFGRKALPSGGGGGRSPARELFDTLLVWRSTVKLDEHGKATAEIKVNDSLTRFRVVAVASAGVAQWGTGETQFVATKDLQARSGLPAVVREGDAYTATFTLRNSTAQRMSLSVNASYTTTSAVSEPRAVRLPAQALTLGPNESRNIGFTATVPALAQTISWRVDAAATSGQTDALVVHQEVASALTPVRFGLGALSMSASSTPTITQGSVPSSAVAQIGEVWVKLTSAYAMDASSVREYIKHYPYVCLEQRTSKAVALKSDARWAQISGAIDEYIARDDLLTYFPGGAFDKHGYPELTAFVMAASFDAGYKLPERSEQRILNGLINYVQGKGEHLEPALGIGDADQNAIYRTEMRLNALDALARYRSIPQAWAESLRLNERDLPKLSHIGLLQWVSVLHRPSTQAWSDLSARRTQALGELSRRTATSSTGVVRLVERKDDVLWWRYSSQEIIAVHLARLTQQVDALSAQRDGAARGAIMLQSNRGHWWGTQANVWGSLWLDARAKSAPSAVSGYTTVAVGTQTWTHDWAKEPKGATKRFWVPMQPGGAVPVAWVHRGGGRPYGEAIAAVKTVLDQPVASNAKLTRKVTPLRQQIPGVWSVGDIVEVKLSFGSMAASGWYVVSDPIPPGATVLGSGLGGQDQVPSEREGQYDPAWDYGAMPNYVERTFSHVRAYFEHMSEGQTFTYQLRLNTKGKFQMPATEFEAMYDPGVMARQPNKPWVIR